MLSAVFVHVSITLGALILHRVRAGVRVCVCLVQTSIPVVYVSTVWCVRVCMCLCMENLYHVAHSHCLVWMNIMDLHSLFPALPLQPLTLLLLLTCPRCFPVVFFCSLTILTSFPLRRDLFLAEFSSLSPLVASSLAEFSSLFYTADGSCSC